MRNIARLPADHLEQVPPRRTWCSMLARGLMWLAAAGAMTSASAQMYPSRPISVIVPGATGTVVDITARLLSQQMSKSMGQPMLVENHPAAGGVPGSEKLVRAAKDGHVIGVVSNTYAISPSVFKPMSFDSVKDIAPISVLASTPLVLVVNPALAAKDARELVGLAKSRPGALNYGSMGNSSVLHLAGVLFNAEGGVDIKHIPYTSFAQLVSDLIGGQIEMGFAGVASVAGHIKTGKLRAIGVSTRSRSAILPDVPTLAESGLPDYSFDGWLAMIAPAGTPKPVLERLNLEVKAALATKEVQDTLAAQGVMIVGSSAEAATEFVQREIAKHAELIRRSGAAQR